MMAEVQEEKQSITDKLAAATKQLKRMDPDSVAYRRLYTEKYNLEREVRQDWY